MGKLFRTGVACLLVLSLVGGASADRSVSFSEDVKTVNISDLGIYQNDVPIDTGSSERGYRANESPRFLDSATSGFNGLNYLDTNFKLEESSQTYPPIGTLERTSNGNFIGATFNSNTAPSMVVKFDSNLNPIEYRRINFGTVNGSLPNGDISGVSESSFQPTAPFIKGASVENDRLAVVGNTQDPVGDGDAEYMVYQFDNNLNLLNRTTIESNIGNSGRLIDHDDTGDVHVIVPDNDSNNNYKKQKFVEIEKGTGDILRSDISNATTTEGSFGTFLLASENNDADMAFGNMHTSYFEVQNGNVILNGERSETVVFADRDNVSTIKDFERINMTKNIPFNEFDDFGEIVDIEKNPQNDEFYMVYQNNQSFDKLSVAHFNNPLVNSQDVVFMGNITNQFVGKKVRASYDTSNDKVYVSTSSGDGYETLMGSQQTEVASIAKFDSASSSAPYKLFSDKDIGYSHAGNGAGMSINSLFVTSNDKLLVTTVRDFGDDNFIAQYSGIHKFDPKTNIPQINYLALRPENDLGSGGQFDLVLRFDDLGVGFKELKGVSASNVESVNETHDFLRLEDPFIDTTMRLANTNGAKSNPVTVNLSRNVIEDDPVFSDPSVVKKRRNVQIISGNNANRVITASAFTGSIDFEGLLLGNIPSIEGLNGIFTKNFETENRLEFNQSINNIYGGDREITIGKRYSNGALPDQQSLSKGSTGDIGFNFSFDGFVRNDVLVNESQSVNLRDNSSKTHSLSSQTYFNTSDIEIDSEFSGLDYETGNGLLFSISQGENIFSDQVLDSGITQDKLNVVESNNDVVLESGVTHNLSVTQFENTTDLVTENVFSEKVENVDISNKCGGAGVKDVPTGTSSFDCPDNVSDVQRDKMVNEEEFFTQTNDPSSTSTLTSQSYTNVTNLRFDNQLDQIVSVNVSSGCSGAGVVSAVSGTNEVTDCSNSTVSGDFLVDTQSVFDKKNESEQVGNLSQQSYREVFDLNTTNTRSFTLQNVDIGGVSNLKDAVDIPSGQVQIEDHRFSLVEGNFISGVEESVSFQVDSDRESNFSTQFFENSSTLSFDNTESVSLGAVDISNRCSSNSRVDVGAGESVNVSCDETDQVERDFLDNKEESNISFPNVAEFGSGINEGVSSFKDYQTDNNFSSSIPVNLSGTFSEPEACSLESNSEQDFPSGLSTQSLRFSCNAGDEVGNPTFNSSDLGDSIEYVYDAEFELFQDPPLGDRQYCVPQTRLNGYSDRITGSRTVSVDGSSSGFSAQNKIVQNDQYVCVNLPTEEIGASVHTASISYEVQQDDTSGGGGGGSSGGGGSGGSGGSDGSGGLIGTGASGEDTGALNVENSTFTWRISALGSPTQSTFSLFGNSGETESIPIQLTNLGDRSVDLNLSVVAERDVVRENVEVSKQNVTLDPDGLGTATANVEYSIPDDYSADNFNFRVRATDQAWDGESETVGVEYADFNIAMNDALSILLDRYSRVGQIISFNPSWTPSGIPIPFILIPLIPAGLVFGLSRTVSGKDGAVLVAQAGGTIIFFIALIGLIPPL